MRALIKKIRQLLKDKRFRKIWYRGVSSTAAIVVFITTYALVLPAITMESEASCGIPAHQHSTDCYEEQLICGLEESEGHHHTDDCYTVTKKLTCTIPEHQHDESCFDENGNLTCSQAEHTHDDTCCEEHRELTCGLEESDGHHHDSSCYKQVLTCGLEAHIHSPECYKEDSNAVTASTSAPASEDSATAVAATAASTSVPVEIDDSDNSSDESNTYSSSSDAFSEKSDTSFDAADTSDKSDITDTNDTTDPSEADSVEDKTDNDDAGQTMTFEESDPASPASDSDEPNPESESSSTAATTDVLPEPVEQENLSDGYVPTLNPVNMDQILDRQTGFYYYHAEEGQDLPASSAEITSWKKVEDNTELASADLVKAYFAYTIPAGTLNETNQIARYRLPANLHLTDDQIMAINQQENGIAASYIDYDTLQILDTDNYHKHLGAEAIEGTRTPDQPLTEGIQEYISAVVKAENVYDDEGVYGEKGAYLGQDLIFIFTPYTIEKNQNTYDTDGNPTSAGQKVSGWFACDFNMGQIDWVEAETGTDHDTTAIEKTADILFAAQDDTRNIKEISQTLKLVETIEAPEDAAEGVTDDVTGDAAKEEVLAEENTADETAEEAATEEVAADVTEDNPTTDNEQSETAPTDATADTDTDTEEEKYSAGTLTATGDSYKITLDYTAEAEIPADSKLHVTEITAESDPEAYEACLKQAQEQVVSDEHITVDKAASRFFDIEIIAADASGKTQKIEPMAPVRVNVQLIETAKTVVEMAEQDTQGRSMQSGDPTVLHFAEDGVETIHADVNETSHEQGKVENNVTVEKENATAIQFDAASFSVYGVVYTTTISRTYVTASGETYEITVTYDDHAGIPDDADLNVRELIEGTDEYNDYLVEAVNRLAITGQDIHDARFFDIEILDGKGKKIEPQTPVKVEITYKDGYVIDKSNILNVVHFADDGVEVIRDVELSSEGTGICYQQSSFSVTGTIVQTPSNNGEERMLIVKQDNRYYIVNNDATLTEVGYDAATNTVIVTDPMLWTFEGSGDNRHVYFHSKATGFGTNLTASDYYRRYLDAAVADAYLEEQNEDSSAPGYISLRVTGTFTGSKGTTIITNEVSDRTAALNATRLTIDADGKIHQGSSYLAIQKDEGGVPVKLVGGQSSADAAQFFFASASKVPSGLHLQNAVNHIDISIQGDAQVQFPLAYGTYYDASGNPIKTVTQNTKLTLTKDMAVNPNQLRITEDDMKRATVTARDKNGKELDDAFYITGFSDNAETDNSTPQVRVEGRFLCADLRGTQYETIDGRRYDGYWEGWYYRWPDDAYVDAVHRARKNNIVDYTVTVVKPVEYYLKDENGNQLYDDEHHALTVTVDVAFSGSFNYWDNGPNERNSGNECPPLQGNSEWAEGDIPNHDLSGMDFVLKGSAENENSPVTAIEITKFLLDESGNPIKVKYPVTNTFDVYENRTANPNDVADMDVEAYKGDVQKDQYAGVYNGFEHSFSKSTTIKAGDSSVIVHRYNIPDGMYYIQEQSDSEHLPETIEDEDGGIWTYTKTYIKTEYVRRGDQYDNSTAYPDPMHVSKDYTDREEQYTSAPEVVGNFIDMNQQVRRSAFLEYFVYNIYTQGKTLPVEKTWAEGTTPPEGTVVVADLYYRKREKGNQNEWSAFTKVEAGKDGFNQSYSVEMNADNLWKNSFEDLPLTWEDPENNKTYELDYTAEESAVLVDGKNALLDYVTQKELDGETVTFTNTRELTHLDAEKTWAEGTTPPAGVKVYADLTYTARKIAEADGISLASPGEWSTYAKVKENDTLSPMFANDPYIDGTAAELKTRLELTENGGWKDSAENLPTRLVAADGVYEVKYSAEETTVLIDEKNAYGDYSVTKDETSGTVVLTNELENTHINVQKRWASGVDIPEGTEVTVELRYRARRRANGSQNAAEWPEDYAPVKTGESTYADLFSQDPLLNESALVTAIVLKESSNWTGTFDNLPKYLVDEEGNAYEVDYSSEETAIKVPPAGTTVQNDNSVDVKDQYDAEVTKEDDTVFIDNSKKQVQPKVKKDWDPDLTSEEQNGAYATVQLKRYKKIVPKAKTEATVVKVWDDENNQDGTRPDRVTVRLKKNGTQLKDFTLNEANHWTVTEPNLDKVDDEDNSIAYTWEEVDVPEGYVSTSSVSGTVTTITNTHAAETKNIRVVKAWDDDNDKNERRPSSLNVQWHNGETDSEPITLNEANGWSATVRVPKQGTYTWTEEPVDDYQMTSNTTDLNTDATTITNKYSPSMTSATVRKIWNDNNNVDGKRPSEVTMYLKNGTTTIETVKLNESNGWTATVSDLPEKGPGGVPINYTWEEASVDDYTPSYTQSSGTTPTEVINTHEREYVRPSVVIVWDDNDNAAGKRPANLDVDLYKGTEKVGTVNVGESDWTGQIAEADKLPKYADGKVGEEITYTWHEPNNFSGYYFNGSERDGDTTTLHYSIKPPKDTITVTLHTVSYTDGQVTTGNDWEVNVENVTVDQDMTTYQGKYIEGDPEKNVPLVWEIPKSTLTDTSKLVFDLGISGGYQLFGITSPNRTKVIDNYNQSGKPRVTVWLNEDDIDIYVAISEDTLPKPVPEPPKNVYVTVQSSSYSANNDLEVLDNINEKKLPTGSSVQVKVKMDPNAYAGNLGVRYWEAGTTGNFNNQPHVEVPLSSEPVFENGKNVYTYNITNISKDIVIQAVTGTAPANYEVTAEVIESTGRNDNWKSRLQLDQSEGDYQSASTGGRRNTLMKSLRGSTAAPSIKISRDFTAQHNSPRREDTSDLEPAISASVPTGYEEDAAFSAKNITVTLNSSNDWTKAFEKQDKYDKWGNEYVYYVVETDCSPTSYKLSAYGANDTLLTEDGLTITNTRENETGDLELTKQVDGDGDTEKAFLFNISLTDGEGTALTGSYQAQLTESGGTSTSATADINNGAVSGISLKSGDTYTIKGLPSGTAYSITENDYSADGYSGSATIGNANGTIPSGNAAKASVTWTNTYNPGTLTVEKVLAGNDTDAGKEFDFQVELENASLSNKTRGNWKKGTAETIASAETQSISFDEDGKATVSFKLKGGEKAVFSKLPVGTTFKTQETSADQDGYETTVQSEGGTANGKTVEGTIAANTSVTATYTNTKDKKNVEAKKVWMDDGQVIAWPEDVEDVQLTLYKTVNGTESVVSTSDVPAIVNPVTITAETTDHKAIWNNLPVKYLTGDTWYPASYSVKETAVHYTAAAKSAGAQDLTETDAIVTAYSTEYDAENSRIINTVPKISISASKEWKNKDDQVLSAQQIPSGAKVTFTLYQGENPVTVPKTVGQETTQVDRTVELKGTDATSGGATPSTDDYEGPNWTAFFTNLPKYTTGGEVITYTVKETGSWTGYEVEGSDTVENGGTITNKEKSFSLDIFKVERDQNIGLPGAEFTLRKIDGDATVISAITGAGAVNKTATTSNESGKEGLATFDKLPLGYYEVTETKAPTGDGSKNYIITGNPSFYIEVADDGIHLLTKPENATGEDAKPKNWQKDPASYGNVKTFTATAEQINAKATVENDQGYELPNSGGFGTRWIYFFGITLTLLATGLLWRRKM